MDTSVISTQKLKGRVGELVKSPRFRYTATHLGLAVAFFGPLTQGLVTRMMWENGLLGFLASAVVYFTLVFRLTSLAP